MAVENVSILDLSNWLSNQPANTKNTPYEILIYGLDDSTVGNLKTALTANSTKYVDLSPTTIGAYISSIEELFLNCTSLVIAPQFHPNHDSFTRTFKGCTSLKEVTLSQSLVYAESAFEGCTSFTTLKFKKNAYIYNRSYSNIFKNCTNLKEFYSDDPYNIKNQLSRLHSESSNFFPNDVSNCHFYLYSETYVEYEINGMFDSELDALSANSASNPYKIKIKGLTRSNYTMLPNYLKRYPTKFVDLGTTVLPSTQTTGTSNYNEYFKDCVSLVVSPILPSSTAQMNRTYKGCTALISMPTIPSSVFTINECFCDCSSLTQVTELPNLSTANSAFKNCTSLVTPPDFPTETSISNTFEGCTSLTSIPNFPPTSILTETFKGCTSLTTVPAIQLKGERYYCNITSVFEGCTSLTSVEIVIGDDVSMLEMGSAFSGCTTLQSFKVKEFTESSISVDGNVFENCTNLLNFYSNDPYELKSWLTELRNASINNFPNNINNCHFYLYSTDYVDMHITVLSNELSALTANTVSTPFKIKITGLTDSNSGTRIIDLNSILLANLTKYVDLKETVIPNGIMIFGSIYKDCTNLIKAPNNIPNSVVSMSQAFSGCTNLVEAPPLPNNVTNLIDAFNGCSSLTTAPVIPASVEGMTNTFKNCTSLTEAPVIPENVDIMIGTFEGCTSLETVPNVPANVTTLTDCFKNCSSLEEIEVFEVPTSVLKTSAADCFSGCTSLTKVGIPAVENPEASDWHIALLEFGATTVKGKFYDRQGNSVTIPETTITKNKLKLPVLTDELMFNTQTSFADLESLIEDVLQYNYGYYNKFVVTPKNKQFVLYANDPVNGFTTNLPFGGGGASDSCPLGTIVPYYGDTAPSSSWLICDGRDTTGTSEELATFYPLLYAFLGTNKLPDFQECTLVGAGKNGTYIFDSTERNPSTGLFGNQSHDVYSVGEFKDDQFQGHSHTYVRPADTENKLNPSSGSRVPRSVYDANTTTIVTDGTDGTPRVGETTHGKQIGVNFIIKATSGASESESASIVRHIDSLIDKISYETLPIGSLISQLNNSFTPYGFLLADGRDTTGTSEELSIHYPLLYSYLGNSNVLPKLYTLDDGHDLEKEYFAGVWRDGKALYRITFEIQTTSWSYNNWKNIKDANWVTAHSINCLIDGWLSEQNNSSTYVKGCSTPLIQLDTSGQLCAYNSFTTVNNPVVYCTILYTKTTDNWALANFKYIKAVSGLEDNSTEAVEVANAISASTASLQAQYDAFVQEVMNAEWRKEYVLYESANTITSLPANTTFTDSLLNYEQVRFYLRRSTSASSDFISVKTLDHSQLVALVDTTIATGSYNLLFEGYSSEYKQLKVSPDGTTVTAIQGAMSLYKVVGVGKITNS